MFIYQSRLKHLLAPEWYWTAEQHALELEKVFLPAWHFAGTRGDMPHDGDFITLELLGKPLLIRNYGGEYHAFLNVCAHRHCLLTTEKKGSAPKIRCPYHGWEYDKHGRTGKIPEAKCFAPFERERAHLVKYRIATCGELIFVSLAPDGPSLEEFLGSAYSVCKQVFSHPWREAWSWEWEYPCNWKIPVENHLESYHMDCLHMKTFGPAPQEDLCTHQFEDNLTTFVLDISNFPANPTQRRVMALLGGPITDRYTHQHVFPNFLFTRSDTYRMIQVVVPISPTRASTVVRFFSYRGDKQNPLARLVAFATELFGIRITKKILQEDAWIFEHVQRGNENTVYPGVLGTREERIFVFQEWLMKKCAPHLLPDSPHDAHGPMQAPSHAPLSAASNGDAQIATVS